MGTEDDDLLGKYASGELFFWAIFLDRFDLATYFCSKTWVRFVLYKEEPILYNK